MSEPERKFTPKEGAADPYATRLVAELPHDRGILTCHYDPAAPFLFAGARDYLLHRWDLSKEPVVEPPADPKRSRKLRPCQSRRRTLARNSPGTTAGWRAFRFLKTASEWRPAILSGEPSCGRIEPAHRSRTLLGKLTKGRFEKSAPAPTASCSPRLAMTEPFGSGKRTGKASSFTSCSDMTATFITSRSIPMAKASSRPT